MASITAAYKTGGSITKYGYPIELMIVGVCAVVNEDKYSMSKHYSARTKASDTFYHQVISFDKIGLIKPGQQVFDQFNTYQVQNINQNFTFDLVKESEVIVSRHNGYTLANLMNVRERNKLIKEIKASTTFSPVYSSDEVISMKLSRAHTALCNGLREEFGTIEIYELPNSENCFSIISSDNSLVSLYTQSGDLVKLEGEDKMRLLAISDSFKKNIEGQKSLITFRSNSDDLSINNYSADLSSTAKTQSMSLL